MIYFVIGAVLLLIQMYRRDRMMIAKGIQNPVSVFLVPAALGAAVYGTILWLIFGLLIGWR